MIHDWLVQPASSQKKNQVNFAESLDLLFKGPILCKFQVCDVTSACFGWTTEHQVFLLEAANTGLHNAFWTIN